MKYILAILLAAPFSLSAKGGDALRERAPVTALLADLQENNAGPLVDAYRNSEIDYFLDIQRSSDAAVKEIASLRAIGRMIANSDITSARQYVSSVSKFKDDQAYLLAVMAAAEGRYEQSLEGFRVLIDKRTDISKRLSTLSFLGAARVFHEIGDYKQAIYHYSQVRATEPEFFQSVFEKAWSFYLDGDMNGTLGATLTFISPYGDKSFYPEAIMLRAAAYFQLCYFDQANETVENLKRTFEPIRLQIERLAALPDAISVLNNPEQIHPRILGGLLRDHSLRSAMRAYIALTDEKKQIGGREAAWNNQALGAVRQRLARDLNRVLNRMKLEIASVLSQADLIQIEILQTGANVLMGAKVDRALVKTIDLKDVDFDELVQFWPFKGEFWFDETGSYYYGLQSLCPTN